MQNQIHHEKEFMLLHTLASSLISKVFVRRARSIKPKHKEVISVSSDSEYSLRFRTDRNRPFKKFDDGTKHL